MGRAEALLRRAVARHRSAVAAGLAAAALQQLAFLALPWAIQHAIDDALSAGDTGATWRWAGVVAAAAVAIGAFGAAGQWYTGRAANRVAHDLRGALLARVATFDRRAMAGFGHGDLAIRLTRDVDMVRDWVQALVAWVRIGVTVVVLVPALCALDVSLLVVAALAVPLVFVANSVFPRRFATANEALSAAHGDRANTIEDLLSATVAVRGLGGEAALVERHHRASAAVTDRTLAAAGLAAWWASVPPAIPRAAIGAGLAVGGLAVLDGRLQIGGLVAFASWMTILATAVAVLVDILAVRRQAHVAAERLQAVLQAPGRAAHDAPRTAAVGLEASGVVVRRDGRTLLGPVDLRVGAGELVAVCGPVGSGKTLLLDVLGGLEDPDEGEVRIGAGRVGVVPQRPALLTASVADNILLGRDLPAAAVRRACAAAAFAEVVDELPDGYDTVVGDRGRTLSGGQAQRLALARALVDDPAVLLLDDATSAVDPVTEQAILAALRGRTVVFASHRPAVAGAADRVLRFDRPGVPEAGRG